MTLEEMQNPPAPAKAVLSQLSPPSWLTGEAEKKWRHDLSQALAEDGCDWAVWFMSRWGNTFSDAVERVCAEVERLRAENAELRRRAQWRETFTLKEEVAK